MRISNNMIVKSYLNNLNSEMARQNEIQEKLSDVKQLHRPSDDPIKVARALRFRTNLASNEQFNQNVKDALSWMNTTDGVMSDMSSIMIRAKELTIQSVSTNDTTAFQAIASELDGLINHMVNIANTQIGDRYIFSGQADKLQPFTRTGDTFTYAGDNNKISMIIKQGEVTPSQDSVNVTGVELFGPSQETLSHLTAIKNELLKNPPDLQWLSNTGLAYIQQDHDNLLTQQTQLGSRMAMYEMADNMMGEDNINITQNLSDNEDLDIAKAIIDFKTSENVYRTALSVGARIMPPSLVDFLK